VQVVVVLGALIVVAQAAAQAEAETAQTLTLAMLAAELLIPGRVVAGHLMAQVDRVVQVL
jgi:proline dehydrogenase